MNTLTRSAAELAAAARTRKEALVQRAEGLLHEARRALDALPCPTTEDAGDWERFWPALAAALDRVEVARRNLCWADTQPGFEFG